MSLLTMGEDINNVIQEQYYLARKANISLLESNLLPLFEKDSLLGFLSEDLKQEAKTPKII